MFSSFELSFNIFRFFLILLFFFFVIHSFNIVKIYSFLSTLLFKRFSFNYWFVVSIFFGILSLNIYGLIPSSFSLTSLISTIFLSFLCWGGLFFFLFFKNPNHNIRHFLPLGTPSILVFPLVFIEILSTFARPVALGFRLLANITAGHLLLILGASGVFYSNIFSVVVFPLFLALVFLEVCVGFIQAYVFSILLILYTEEREI